MMDGTTNEHMNGCRYMVRWMNNPLIFYFIQLLISSTKFIAYILSTEHSGRD